MPRKIGAPAPAVGNVVEGIGDILDRLFPAPEECT
jgi:hypothetical protein